MPLGWDRLSALHTDPGRARLHPADPSGRRVAAIVDAGQDAFRPVGRTGHQHAAGGLRVGEQVAGPSGEVSGPPRRARRTWAARPVLPSTQQAEVRQRLTDGETHADLGRSYAVGISTIQPIKNSIA